IDIDVFKPGCARQTESGFRFVRRVNPPQRFQALELKRLHAERKTVHAVSLKQRKPFGVHGSRIGLAGKFRRVEFSNHWKEFFQALEHQNKVLKALLLNQSFVAGVGNIYADEALFEARLDPRRKSLSLSEDEVSKLWKAVRRVIEAGVRNGGTSLGDGQGNYVDLNGEAGGHRKKVKVYGRAGQPCVVCKKPLHKTLIVQRTTVFCAHCQK
ncbi:MAG: zinc finger domain-containing protein, partial [Kiritimatiellales bacterium]